MYERKKERERNTLKGGSKDKKTRKDRRKKEILIWL